MISLVKENAAKNFWRTLAACIFIFCLAAALSFPATAVTVEDARRDFETVQKINTREAYEAFLKQYPEGLYAGLAREELKKLDGLALAQLIRAVNFELARVGCAPNSGGEEWTPESQIALAQFNLHANVRLDLNRADLATLAALRDKTSRVCPLACGLNERVQADSCVAVAPPTPPPAAKQPQQPAPKKQPVAKNEQPKSPWISPDGKGCQYGQGGSAFTSMPGRIICR